MTFKDALKRYRLQLILCFLLMLGLYYKVIQGMAIQWYKDENYSHGFIIPFISCYFLSTRWRDLERELIAPWGLGLLVIILGLLQFTFGWLGTENFTMRSSFIVILAGLILFFFGRSVFRLMLLPLAYLIFMIPLPYIIYDAAAFPLKIFITKISVAFLKLIGVVVLREGNIIMFPEITLEVADACSGMRSLMSLIALGVAYAYISQKSTRDRLVIIFSTIPIAIICNSMRVIFTGILAQYWGTKAAEGFFHEFAGLAVFALAMALMLAVGLALKWKNDKRSNRNSF